MHAADSGPVIGSVASDVEVHSECRVSPLYQDRELEKSVRSLAIIIKNGSAFNPEPHGIVGGSVADE